MARQLWTRDELIVAFNLYCKLPFGKYHRGNPQVIALARLLRRTPSAVAMKLCNFASFDPTHQRRGVGGLKNTARSDEEIWNEFNANWDALAIESEQALENLQGAGSWSTDTHEGPMAGGDGLAELDFERATESERIMKVRLRQRFFRLTILAGYGGRCCICSLNCNPLLVASHITPACKLLTNAMIRLSLWKRKDGIMAISLPDARQLSDEVLEALRLRAVHGCELGFTETDVADLLGVARETVSRWWAAYSGGGPDALPHDRTGRPRGSGRVLDDAQARHLQQVIDEHTPDEVGLTAPLWTRRAVQELIQREYGRRLPLRTVGEYLRRWGYTPKRPSRHSRHQDPAEVEAWLTRTYPAIAARAAREGTEIHWCDETGVEANEHPGRGYARVGQTPTMNVSGNRFRVNEVSTITNQGKMRFMTYTSTLTAAVFLVFLGRLLRRSRKKVFLILDRHPAHEAAAVAAWVAQQGGRIELFWLPRQAGELNPDEYLNQELKGQVNAQGLPDTRPELESNIQRFLNKLKEWPTHVKRYFQHPKVQYAASIS